MVSNGLTLCKKTGRNFLNQKSVQLVTDTHNGEGMARLTTVIYKVSWIKFNFLANGEEFELNILEDIYQEIKKDLLKA